MFKTDDLTRFHVDPTTGDKYFFLTLENVSDIINSLDAVKDICHEMPESVLDVLFEDLYEEYHMLLNGKGCGPEYLTIMPIMFARDLDGKDIECSVIIKVFDFDSTEQPSFKLNDFQLFITDKEGRREATAWGHL